MRSWDLSAEQNALRAAGLWRELRVRDGFSVGQFASNDYLGLAQNADLAAALCDGVGRYGSGATGSRLICGTTEPHCALEEAIIVVGVRSVSCAGCCG